MQWCVCGMGAGLDADEEPAGGEQVASEVEGEDEEMGILVSKENVIDVLPEEKIDEHPERK